MDHNFYGRDMNKRLDLKTLNNLDFSNASIQHVKNYINSGKTIFPPNLTDYQKNEYNYHFQHYIYIIIFHNLFLFFKCFFIFVLDY